MTEAIAHIVFLVVFFIISGFVSKVIYGYFEVEFSWTFYGLGFWFFQLLFAFFERL